MSTFKIRTIKGMLPAMVTSFDIQGNFDENGQREVVDFLLNQGSDGLYITGSTGETFLMDSTERKSVTEVVCDQVNKRKPVIAHIGAIGTKTSIDLAKHAEKCGVDAISAVPPFYWRFNENEIFSYYNDICKAVDIPMIVYNIPLAGTMGYPLIKRLAEIENVKGIKYTASTHHEITRIKNEIGNDFMVYSGVDEMALSGLMSGSDGIIGSFYNLLPELFKDIYTAVKEDRLLDARKYQMQANEIIMYVLDNGFLSTIKRTLNLTGVHAGEVRAPFTRLRDEEEKVVMATLNRINKEVGPINSKVLSMLGA